MKLSCHPPEHVATVVVVVVTVVVVVVVVVVVDVVVLVVIVVVVVVVVVLVPAKRKNAVWNKSSPVCHTCLYSGSRQKIEPSSVCHDHQGPMIMVNTNHMVPVL